MKVFFNRKIRRSAWGGGSHFATGLFDFLSAKGFSCTNEYENNVDVILMFDPRDEEGFADVNTLIQYKEFLRSRGSPARVVHRINDSDVPRGTSFLVDLNIRSNSAIADKTVFISEWIRDHYVEKGFNRHSRVITNGCNTSWFKRDDREDSNSPIKVVTHHWSDNYNKGFDTYIEIDKAISSRSDIEFTYIGRYFQGYKPTNTRVIAPMYGRELGQELARHDVYVTAARWEACGMHHIEAAACGLPVAYHRDGGGVNEICSRHGREFSSPDHAIDAILDLASRRREIRSRIDLNLLSEDLVFQRYLDFMLE
jgi:glycosyltransferase involved in cell wall biosynthesis